MSFFRTMWKNNSKHKKLCDYSDNLHMDELDEITDDSISYTVKYLGNTAIDAEVPEANGKKIKQRSDEVTAKAIKKILGSSKSNKKQARVTLSISPKGIETFDPITGETLLQVSIYKISYCSVDASQQNVFAFVSSSSDKIESFDSKTTEFGSTSSGSDTEDEGSLICYAFLCQKRKMAHNVTITVARAFERAYQIWQNQQFMMEKRKKETKKMNKENQKNASDNIGEQPRSLLIDFSAEESTTSQIYSRDHRDYLQNTWVSFEDDRSIHELNSGPVKKIELWDSNRAPLCL